MDLNRRDLIRLGGLGLVSTWLAGSRLLGGCTSKTASSSVDRIYFVTVDTLRADHLSCYGYPRRTSPFLDRLAEEGIWFKNTIASMATTNPSHASMFTALYPMQHGVLENGFKLNPALFTMSDDLALRGFFNGAFVSTKGHFAGFERSFEVFDRPAESKRKYRPAMETVSAAMDWIGPVLRSNKKVFVWIHLFDPHTPYWEENPFLEQFRRESEEKSAMLKDFYIKQHKSELAFWENEVRENKASAESIMLETMDHYDAELRLADSSIEQFFSFIDESGGNRNSLWIITSDHGEGLGTHNWHGHGKHIYNEQILIPTICYFGDKRNGNSVILEPIEHVDLWPTVSDLVDGDIRKQIFPVQGYSLIRILEGWEKYLDKERLTLSQRRKFDPTPPDGFQENPTRFNYESGKTFAVQSSTHKLIFRTQGQCELFSLRQDPYEQNSMLQENQRLAESFRQHLLYKFEQFSIGQAGIAAGRTKSKDAIKNLRELGYL